MLSWQAMREIHRANHLFLGAADLVAPRHVNISSRHVLHDNGSRKCSGNRSDCRLDVDEIVFGSLICLRTSAARRQYLRFWKRPMWDGELEERIGVEDIAKVPHE